MTPVDPDLVRALAQGTLLAVDPGTRFPAAALFDRGILQAASRIPVPGALAKLPGHCEAERCRQVSQLIASWALDAARSRCQGRRIDAVVVEWPRIVKNPRGQDNHFANADPNDLLYLSGIDVGVACLLGVSTTAPRPENWIGSIKKVTSGDPLKSPRGQIVWMLLRPDERERVVVSHDSLDAVGIGLWQLGRLGRFGLRPTT